MFYLLKCTRVYFTRVGRFSTPYSSWWYWHPVTAESDLSAICSPHDEALEMRLRHVGSVFRKCDFAKNIAFQRNVLSKINHTLFTGNPHRFIILPGMVQICRLKKKGKKSHHKDVKELFFYVVECVAFYFSNKSVRS